MWLLNHQWEAKSNIVDKMVCLEPRIIVPLTIQWEDQHLERWSPFFCHCPLKKKGVWVSSLLPLHATSKRPKSTITNTLCNSHNQLYGLTTRMHSCSPNLWLHVCSTIQVRPPHWHAAIKVLHLSFIFLGDIMGVHILTQVLWAVTLTINWLCSRWLLGLPSWLHKSSSLIKVSQLDIISDPQGPSWSSPLYPKLQL